MDRAMSNLDSIFKALGDPVRVRMAQMLAENGELCVGDILEEFQMTQPAISHHLAVLKHAGLVNSRKAGQWVYYSLIREALSDQVLVYVQQLLDAFDASAASTDAVPEPAEIFTDTRGSDPDTFRALLSAVYREFPGQVLPYTLAEALTESETCSCSFDTAEGVPAELYMWNADSLKFYWNKDRHFIGLTEEFMSGIESVVIHDDYLGQMPIDAFDVWHPHFRLVHTGELPTHLQPIPGIMIAQVDIGSEIFTVSEFAAHSFDQSTSISLMDMIQRPTFSEDLWIWLLDVENGTPAGLGIAEFDQSTAEGSLKWVQVLPEYHGRGLGKLLVFELLGRLKDRSALITVSGESDSPASLENFLRKCGFTGNDIWWSSQRRMVNQG